jgi:hypothetical protein
LKPKTHRKQHGFGENPMAYTPAYTSDDVSAVVIDKGTLVLITIGSFALLLAVYLAKKLLGK